MRQTTKDNQKLNLSAAVLAGGDSKRMGEDKAFLELGGERLIDIIIRSLAKLFKDIIVVTDKPEKMNHHLQVRLEEDIYKDGEKNALRGIHASLTLAFHPSCFIVACDMPFISLPLVRYMSQFARDYDLVTPRVEGYYQPLFSFYNKTALPVITSALELKNYKISSLYGKFNTREIKEDIVDAHDRERLSFTNINSPEKFKWAQSYYREHHSSNSV